MALESGAIFGQPDGLLRVNDGGGEDQFAAVYAVVNGPAADVYGRIADVDQARGFVQVARFQAIIENCVNEYGRARGAGLADEAGK